MVAVPSHGRATGIEAPPLPREAVATQELYERYAGRIFGFCLHQLGSREEAEDAAQTTFMNAFRALQRGVEPELESAWLFKIAANVCHTRVRTSIRRRRLETPSDIDALQDVLPAAPADRADELHRLEEALAGMPEQQRRAILLREWQGLTYREVARELQISQAAVETLIFRARRSLAERLDGTRETGIRRLRGGANVGSILAGLKSLLVGGSTAVKVAAAIAIASGAGAAAATPSPHHAPAVTRTTPTRSEPVRARLARPVPTTAFQALAESHTRARQERPVRTGTARVAHAGLSALRRERIVSDVVSAPDLPAAAESRRSVPLAPPAVRVEPPAPSAPVADTAKPVATKPLPLPDAAHGRTTAPPAAKDPAAPKHSDPPAPAGANPHGDKRHAAPKPAPPGGSNPHGDSGHAASKPVPPVSDNMPQSSTAPAAPGDTTSVPPGRNKAKPAQPGRGR